MVTSLIRINDIKVLVTLHQFCSLCISFAHFGYVYLTLGQFCSLWVSFDQFGSL